MRTSHFRRLALTAAALPIAFASLAACGSDDEADKASDSASDSSSTSASPDEASSETPAGEAPAEGESVDPADFVAEYKAAFAKESTAHMTMETEGSAAFSAEGDIDYSTTPPSMAMTMSGPMAEAGIEMRLVDGVMYMAMPNSDGKFISFDLDDPNNPLGGDLSKQLDPATAFDQFEDAITSVTYLGEESVEGEDMRRYTMVVDSTKMAGTAQAPKGSLPEELTFDVWLDGDGLFRKMESDLGASGKLTMNADDWGKDVSIEAPPASQVTTMPGTPSMSPAG